MVQVQMPDGAIVEMPDQLDPQLGARLRSFQQANLPHGSEAGAAFRALNAGASAVETPIAAAAARLGAGAAHDVIDPRINPQAAGEAVTRALAAPAPQTQEEASIRGIIPHLLNAIQSLVPQKVESTVERGVNAIPQPIKDTATLLAPLAGGEGALPARVAEQTVARAPEDIAVKAGYTGLKSRADLAQPGAQAITNKLIAKDAGLPDNVVPNQKALADARANGPGKVYNAVQDALPDNLTHDPQLVADIKGLQDSTSQLPRSPDVETLQQTMLGQPELTRGQLFSNIQQARERAATNLASDDPDKNALGHAYSQLADAYEGFAGRQLPANAPVSLSDFQNARVQFAKNYLAEKALKGGENFDPLAYARIAAKDPGLLTGNAAIVGNVANNLPAQGSTAGARAAGYAAGGVAGTVAGHALGEPLGGGIVGGYTGSHLAPAVQNAIQRMFTRGNPELAAGTTENPALSYFFGERASPAPPPAGPQAPNFTLGEGVNPAGPAPAPPGGFSLADLLAHGVEHPAPGGLSLAPEPGVAARGATPDFAPSEAERLSGGLSLAPESAGAAAPRYSQLGDVMSQGVPEGIVQRSGRHVTPGATVLQGENSYIALTPHEDGSLRITNAYVDPAQRGKGLGQQQLLDAARHAQDLKAPLHSDTSVSAAQARAYEAARSKGLIDFDVTDPGAWSRGLAQKNDSHVIKAGKDQPVIQNIRPSDPSLSAALAF